MKKLTDTQTRVLQAMAAGQAMLNTGGVGRFASDRYELSVDGNQHAGTVKMLIRNGFLREHNRAIGDNVNSVSLTDAGRDALEATYPPHTRMIAHDNTLTEGEITPLQLDVLRFIGKHTHLAGWHITDEFSLPIDTMGGNSNRNIDVLLKRGLIEESNTAHWRYAITDAGRAAIAALSAPVASATPADAADAAAGERVVYVYGMLNRPAMYGTCPPGRIAELDTEMHPDYQWGTVSYAEPLPRDEQYRYEMFPVSPNAYKYQIGDKVEYCGDTAEVVAQQRMGRYKLRFDEDIVVEYVDASDIEEITVIATVPAQPPGDTDTRYVAAVARTGSADDGAAGDVSIDTDVDNWTEEQFLKVAGYMCNDCGAMLSKGGFCPNCEADIQKVYDDNATLRTALETERAAHAATKAALAAAVEECNRAISSEEDAYNERDEWRQKAEHAEREREALRQQYANATGLAIDRWQSELALESIVDALRKAVQPIDEISPMEAYTRLYELKRMLK